MLIGLIIALIFGVSGGAESEFASYIPHLKKEIRQNVPEKARKDTLMILVKDFERTIKKYDKKKKKLLKDVKKSGMDRTVSTEAFLQTYDDFYNTRIETMSQLIDYRLMFQEKITQYELFMITEKALETKKKAKRKEEKQLGKADKNIKKVFRDINDIILKHIDDSTKTEIVEEQLTVFEKTVYTNVEEARTLRMERMVMLNVQDASREDIEALYVRTNQLRYQASRNYAALREVLIQNTNEREWKAIKKELKVFLQS
jgi:hypothetical protein